MDRQYARSHGRIEDAPHARARACDMPGCAGTGDHRAPKGRDRLNDYHWFCLDHVREYNRAWDYYVGMSEREIEADLRHDTTWQRPTWPMGDWRARERHLAEEAMRAYAGRTEARPPPPPPPPRSAEEEAMAVLDLDPPADFARIKARYRELAKKHHPDINGGDKLAEERLKRINQAYTVLKASYGL